MENSSYSFTRNVKSVDITIIERGNVMYRIGIKPNKIMKMISILLIAFILIIGNGTRVNAISAGMQENPYIDEDETKGAGMQENPYIDKDATTSTGSSAANDGLGDLGQYKGTNAYSEELKSKAGVILGVLQTIGTVVSIVMLMIIGIKYMLGSVEEKANYKRTLIPYIVGAFLIFTGTLLPQIIYNIMQGMKVSS